jgi:hypothetical protein
VRKSSIFLGVLSVTCALAAAASWWQLRAARERVAALEQELAGLQARAEPKPGASVTMASPAPQVAAATVRDPDPKATTAPAAEQTQQEKTNELIRASQARERELMRDPAYRESRYADWRRRYAQTRADAIRVVGLPPELADRLVDLAIERNFAAMDLVGMGGPMSEEAQAAMKRLNEQHDAKLRELLGEEHYQRWQWYEASAGARYDVAQFRAQLSTTAEPLQDRQADGLVEALYSERRRRDAEYEEYVKAAGITDRNVVSPQDRQQWLDLEKASNQRIHDSMAGLLSRNQLASLDAMLAANVAPVEAALRLQLQGSVAKSN